MGIQFIKIICVSNNNNEIWKTKLRYTTHNERLKTKNIQYEKLPAVKWKTKKNNNKKECKYKST